MQASPAGADVESFGERLRQAREARHITLPELAASTKIGTRTLQALEDERLDQLPGGIFNKGFIRSYAREVGLDEEEMVAAYMQATNAAPREPDLSTLADQVEAARGKPSNSGPNAATVVGVLAVLVAIILAGIWLTQHRKDVHEAEAERRQAEIKAAQTSAPAPVPQTQIPATAAPNDNTPTTNPETTNATTPPAATTAAAPTTAAKPAQSGDANAAVRVEIKATARAWISVLRDDHPAETLTLDPANPEASSRSYAAGSRVKLIVGNPAGIAVTFNGKPIGPLGKSGQRVTVDFTPQGMEKH